MHLEQLARGIALPDEARDLDITGLTADSRAVVPGYLFAALKGATVNGARFAAKAVDAGAVAILCDRESADQVRADIGGRALVLVSDDPRKTFALMAAAFYGDQPKTIVAVTGTSGKTSVAFFVRQIFQAAGHSAAALGTIGTVTAEGREYGSLTTPDPVSLQRELALLAKQKITHVALEASSHGLDQHRLDGVRLTAAGFTNLGRDHMDYHPTVEDYLRAKLRLFSELLPNGGTVVADPGEPYADRVIAVAADRGLPVISVGETGKDLKLTGLRPAPGGQQLTIQTPRGDYNLMLPLIGRFQVSNALIAAGLAIAAGVDTGKALRSLESLKGAPGRLEFAGRKANGAAVYIDYAHKPDALENALAALRPFTSGKLIVIFGAGGDRDAGKRPIMGKIAADKADVAIVSDDNPRSEDPARIRQEIMAACPGAIEIGDRSEAIREGVRLLGPGDILCVAGKGHETGQIVGNTVHHFSDHEAVAEALAMGDAQ